MKQSKLSNIMHDGEPPFVINPIIFNWHYDIISEICNQKIFKFCAALKFHLELQFKIFFNIKKKPFIYLLIHRFQNVFWHIHRHQPNGSIVFFCNTVTSPQIVTSFDIYVNHCVEGVNSGWGHIFIQNLHLDSCFILSFSQSFQCWYYKEGLSTCIFPIRNTWGCTLAMSPQIATFMGPTWGPSGSCRPQMGPMLAPWILLSGPACACCSCRDSWPRYNPSLMARFMGPTWGPSGADRTHAGPTLAPWTLLSGFMPWISTMHCHLFLIPLLEDCAGELSGVFDCVAV